MLGRVIALRFYTCLSNTIVNRREFRVAARRSAVALAVIAPNHRLKEKSLHLPHYFRIPGRVLGSTLELSSDEFMASLTQGTLTAYSVVASRTIYSGSTRGRVTCFGCCTQSAKFYEDRGKKKQKASNPRSTARDHVLHCISTVG